MNKQINDNIYFSVQAWMITKLNLKGAERDTYAIIYGYSQDEDSDFHGSLDYISQLTGYSRNAVCTALKSLVEKNLIIKTEKTINNIKYCRYRTSSLYGVQVACTENEKSVQVACTNNKSKLNNKHNNKTISKDIVENFLTSDISVKPKKQSLWDKCVSEIDNFTDDTILREYLIEYLKKCLENSRESGRPMYLNNFKGKLNKLKQLSTDNYIQRKIVLQTLDNGWNAFYELKEEKQYRKKDVNVFGEDAKVKSEAYTDDELEEMERINKEREKKGMRTKF